MHKNNFSPLRVAVTGFSLCNALGDDTESVRKASLDLQSGLVRLTESAGDPPGFFTEPFVPGLTSYSDVLGRCRPECTRQDLSLPPQDFQALSFSSKLSLLTGRRAVLAAGLDAAGYDTERVAVLVSQNAGEAASTLWDLNLALHAAYVANLAGAHGQWNQEQKDTFAQSLRTGRLSPGEATMLCRLNCTAAGMLCRQFGFSGPSFSTGAACSSSMAALATAVHMLRDGSIDAALIGGGEEMYAPLYMAEFSALGALARANESMTEASHYSRPFDRHRNGFVLGEGAAMLVLEREDKAKERGAHIHGLITGLGNVTNLVGLIEPNAAAQAGAIRQSFANLDYGPEAVELIECHATSTIQGDLEEARALLEIYTSSHKDTVLSGYKGQIGHTTGASGAMALIHGLWAMEDGIFPGTINYTEEDPAFNLASARLRVLSTPEEWKKPASGIRRMQVNSFAFGGACFALQVEENNDRSFTRQHQGVDVGASANVPGFAGSESVENGVRFVSLTHAQEEWRLGTTSTTWMHDLANLPPAPDTETLTALTRRGLWLSKATKAPRVAVTCCGQGSVWPGMGRALYDTFPAARAAMDRIAAVAEWDVLSLLDEKDLDKIVLTRWQQPYLFLLEYAQASYLESLGFKPDVMSGHSLGELIALCMAGVYTPEQGWLILDTRAQFMGDLESKATRDMGMMAVHGPLPVVEETLRTFPDLHVSNYNTPTQFILSGPRDVLTEARRTLRKNKVPAILLNVSMAFHHPSMRVLRELSYDRLHQLDMQPARMPMLSNVTTELYPNDTPSICQYICDLDENSVRWVECVNQMWDKFNVRHFVEFGPADTVSGLTEAIKPEARCVATGRKDKEVEGMRSAVAQLYALGHLPQRQLHAVPEMPKDASSAKKTTVQAPAHTPAKAVDMDTTAPPHVEDIMPLIMEATGYERHELGADMDLRHDLAIRSSRFPMIMRAAEERFQITVNFEDLIQVATVRDLADVLALLRACPVEENTGEKQNAPATSAATATPTRSKSDDVVLESIPVWRYAPRLHPIELPKPVQDGAIASLSPLLLVGRSALAFQWRTFLAPLLKEQGLMCAATPAQALALLQEGKVSPQALILAAEEDEHEPSAVLTTCTLLLKSFLAHRNADLCLVTSASPETTLREPLCAGPLHAGLEGLLLSCSLEYPKTCFRAVLSDATLSPQATETWMRQALSLDSQALNTEHKILCWYINSLGARSLQLQAGPWDTKAGLPLRKGDVILVSGGGRGITPHALKGIAPLGCTLVLLGRSAEAKEGALSDLENLGATVHYISCDITNAEAVQASVAKIRAEFGKIDGVMHCAGLNKDATLAVLTPEDVEQVRAIKCRGLFHLLEACRHEGLRYALAFSSLAGWLGNYGQSNYSAANRSMSALLGSLGNKYGLPWRCVWLPPVTGEGMAAGEDMCEQLRMRGLNNAWLTTDELGPLLAREVLSAGSGHALWARSLPSLPTVIAAPPVSEAASRGLAPRPETFPMTFPQGLLAGPHPSFTAQRYFSRYADKSLAQRQDQNIPPALILAALEEAALQSAAWLNSAGLENIHIHPAFQCPGGVTRESSVHTRWEGWSPYGQKAGDEHKSLTLSCTADLAIRHISANGRRKDHWNAAASATVLLQADNAPLNLMKQLLLADQNVLEETKESTFIDPEEIAAKSNSRYAWVWHYFDLLLQEMEWQGQGIRIERLLHVHTLPSRQKLRLTWHEIPGTNGTYMGSVHLEDGCPVLMVQNLRFEKEII